MLDEYVYGPKSKKRQGGCLKINITKAQELWHKLRKPKPDITEQDLIEVRRKDAAKWFQEENEALSKEELIRELMEELKRKNEKII